MLEFAAWLTRRRERVCLVQRVDSGPRMGMGTYIADYYTYSAPVARGLALSMSPFGASSSTGWSRDLDVVGRDRPHAATPWDRKAPSWRMQWFPGTD